MDNRACADSLIDQLVLQGVTRFCIAPGSRSTPLAIAAKMHPHAKCTVHFDERGLGFFALGQAMASSQGLSALIVTSGTALGNLLPAVMEARHARIPLILLTADRPSELLDCGANQTTDQTKLFQNFALWQAELPCPDSSLRESYVRSQAVQLVFYAMHRGPVHLNCRFRDPLFQENPSLVHRGEAKLLSLCPKAPHSEQISYVERVISFAKRGLIVIGRMPPFFDPTPILKLAKDLQWPVFADLTSQARRYPSSEQILFYDLILEKNPPAIADTVLWFGQSLIFERSIQWLQNCHARFLQIDTHCDRIDPFHFGMHRIQADPGLLCQSIRTQCDRSDKQWLLDLQKMDRAIQKQIDLELNETALMTEASWMRALSEALSPETALFLGNSMPIRNASHFFSPSQYGPLFSNRGLSGIDGQIATAAGIATQLKRPLCAILGDLSCLHDLNSLPLLLSIQSPFTLIISNNYGGGIFSHLPLASLDPSSFEELFAANHSFEFKEAAKMFSIPYRKVFSQDEIRNSFSPKGACIVEICTFRKENACFQKQILEKCFNESLIHS